MVLVFVVVGFGVGLGMSYLLYPYPTPEAGDASGIERLVVTLIVTVIAAGLGNVLRGERKSDLRASEGQQAASTAAEIGGLADLRDRGVLSEAEFQEQKKKLLGER